MFCHWMPLQGLVAEDPLVAVAPDHPLLQDLIQLQNPPNPRLLHHNHFHNPHPNRKATSGEVLWVA